MRGTPDFRPTHFTALFDATAHSVALRRYAMLTGAFERARQEDKAESFGAPAGFFDFLKLHPKTKTHYVATSPQQLENLREQESRAGDLMRDRHARLVVQVEALGGRVKVVDHDYCEIEGLTEEQWNNLWSNL